jgi:hypothetical protein
MALKGIFVSQLVSFQLSDPSALGAALKITASVGCMHGVASMLVQVVVGFKTQTALCTSVQLIRMIISEV